MQSEQKSDAGQAVPGVEVADAVRALVLPPHSTPTSSADAAPGPLSMTEPNAPLAATEVFLVVCMFFVF